jgi:Amt family ammonium transporter
MAERTQFAAYLGYSALLTGFVYPTVVHWAWSSDGWLTSVPWKKEDGDKSLKYQDFAGSGVVHMVGGFAGLMGAIMVGPRTGRFDAQGRPIAMPGHNAALVVLGTFILWVGWYGFNCGSQASATSADDASVIGRVGITTTLAASAGGVTSLFLNYALYKVWDLIAVCNGVLAGLVSITAGCAVLDLYMAIFAGFIGAFVLFGSSKLLLKLRIDDPLEAFPVHGACGMWGVLAVGLFAKEKYLGDENNDRYGALMGGNGRLFGVQLLAVVCIILWTCGILGPFFFVLKQAGLLRTSAEEEAAGLDESKHGGSAYNNA